MEKPEHHIFVCMSFRGLEPKGKCIAIARSCPTLEFDMQIEVRPVGEECPMTKHARQMLAEEQFAAA